MKKINVLLIFLFVLSRCSSGGEVTSEIQVGDAADEESQFAEEEIAEAADDLLYESEGEFIPEKGGFLYPCETNDECLSGFCVEGEDGFFCTIKCLEDCPEGFACQGVLVTWPDVTFICIPLLDKTCQPCKSDIQCSGGRCIPLEDKKYCLNQCQEGGCPDKFSCEEKEDPLSGELVDFCVPVSGSCGCTPQDVGTQVVCKKATEFSICYGVQFCEEGGYGECILPPEICDGKDNNCDGKIDEDFIDADTGKYVADNHCGVCNNNCSAMNYPNSEGVCNKEKAVPDCTLKCDDDYFDINKNTFDGCECHFTDQTDYPDGTDQNCDSVDGEIQKAVFVAKNGDDGNEGTMEHPMLTVQAGIDLAHLKGLRDVYAATGVYLESIELKQGIGVYGGYSSDFHVRDALLYETVIFGQPQTAGKKGAVNALNISVPLPEKTVLDGFVVFGADGVLPGQSSYAVYIHNSGSQLEIRHNRIIAGKGAPGNGGNHGLSGSNGQSGGNGNNAFDIGKQNCNATNAGGQGGSHSCGGVNVSGGGGGNAICPDYDENVSDPKCPGADPAQTVKSQEKGSDGKNSFGSYGKGGDAGFDQFTSAWYGPYVTFPCLQKSDNNCSVCYIPEGSLNGVDGTDGDPGNNGDMGFGCLDIGVGYVLNGEWFSMDGNSGVFGTEGGGGGGGGAGGGVETYDCQNTDRKYTDIGGSGGGGGSGGCGAENGGGGKGGGGSFAVFIYFDTAPGSIPSLAGNDIITNKGGDGGNGGNGGVAGKGGSGGLGGKDGGNTLDAKCAPKGGHGGNGGNGGHGGGGGGGCGGGSFGIFSYGHGYADLSGLGEPNNTFYLKESGGAGGTGGASIGNSGGNGLPGASGKTNF